MFPQLSGTVQGDTSATVYVPSGLPRRSVASLEQGCPAAAWYGRVGGQYQWLATLVPHLLEEDSPATVFAMWGLLQEARRAAPEEQWDPRLFWASPHIHPWIGASSESDQHVAQ